MACRAAFTLLGLLMVAGCSRPIKSGLLIDHYKEAACVPLSSDPVTSNLRAWSYTLKTSQGKEFQVFAHQSPGGKVILRYLPNGEDIVAANSGDYVYPADIRFNPKTDRLYAKTQGIPVIGDQETWLFEYDVPNQRRLARKQVDPTVLPQECEAFVETPPLSK